MPSFTRRQLLGGTAVAAGASGGYYLYQRDPDTVFGTWTPESGTWPLAQYDTANTAHNPRATPPRQEPARRTLTSVERHLVSDHPLVGDSSIVLSSPEGVSQYQSGRGLTPITAGDTIGAAGIGPDGRLHVAQRPADEMQWYLVGYDRTTEVYRVPFSDGYPEGVIVGQGGAYVWTTGDTVAIEPGGRSWTVEGEKSALAGNRLYSAVGLLPGLYAHTGRTGLDSVLRAGPKRVWETEMRLIETYAPAVTDGRLVLIGTGRDPLEWRISAYDAESGDRLWEPLTHRGTMTPPAVVDGRTYTAIGSEDRQSGRVVTVDLATGETVWEDETDWYPQHPALGGDTLVVVGEIRDGQEVTANTVRAYDAESGDVLWTETIELTGTDDTFPGRALVGDRVLVVFGNTLYELA